MFYLKCQLTKLKILWWHLISKWMTLLDRFVMYAWVTFFRLSGISWKVFICRKRLMKLGEWTDELPKKAWSIFYFVLCQPASLKPTPPHAHRPYYSSQYLPLSWYVTQPNAYRKSVHFLLYHDSHSMGNDQRRQDFSPRSLNRVWLQSWLSSGQSLSGLITIMYYQYLSDEHV